MTLGDLLVLKLQDTMYELVWVWAARRRESVRAVPRVLDYIRRRSGANHGAQRLGAARYLDVRARGNLVGRGGAANMRESDHAVRGKARCGRGQKRKVELQAIASDARQKTWRRQATLSETTQ